MSFKTYQPTTEDKQQTENKKTYQILKGLNILKSITPKVLTILEKQEQKIEDPTDTCKYFKVFKNFGNINEILKSEGKKKKDLKQICQICKACNAFI
jgi:hypothetical protein